MWSALWRLLTAAAIVQNNQNVDENNRNSIVDMVRDEELDELRFPAEKRAEQLITVDDEDEDEDDHILLSIDQDHDLNQDRPKIGRAIDCPSSLKYGKGPPANCSNGPIDPNGLPPSAVEKWLTEEMFKDLFPFANLGWGSHPCSPYSYQSFSIATRYFPRFGAESPNKNYTPFQNHRRDLAAFFAHAVQETGENNIALYTEGDLNDSDETADNCFYRGGFFNWFEGGPTSSFLDPDRPGHDPSDGARCTFGGVYCTTSPELDHFFPCSKKNSSSNNKFYKGCYFGRGAIQFQDWLRSVNITVDLLQSPNLLMTKMDPPLAILASLWFYMTPQPPKPAMHDIVMGKWNAGPANRAKGYTGPIFGPTSLVINNECTGEDKANPGEGGENRRIKAFKWFTKYFQVPPGPDHLLSCKGMPMQLDMIQYPYSYQPDWANTWKEQPCTCAPAKYGGIIPYFDPEYYPSEFVALNKHNYERCVSSIYANPVMYSMNSNSSACLNYRHDKRTNKKKRPGEEGGEVEEIVRIRMF